VLDVDRRTVVLCVYLAVKVVQHVQDDGERQVKAEDHEAVALADLLRVLQDAVALCSEAKCEVKTRAITASMHGVALRQCD
jgi:hypothetical protein